MRNGPISSMMRPSTGSAARRCSTARPGSKPSAWLSFMGGVAIYPRALDRQHAALGGDAPLGGKAADLAAGGEHAMARHYDRERISAERLPDRARRTGCADPPRDVAVGERPAGRNGAGGVTDAPMVLVHLIHVEGDPREIARVAAQQRGDALDGLLHLGRRRC